LSLANLLLPVTHHAQKTAASEKIESNHPGGGNCPFVLTKGWYIPSFGLDIRFHCFYFPALAGFKNRDKNGDLSKMRLYHTYRINFCSGRTRKAAMAQVDFRGIFVMIHALFQNIQTIKPAIII
jgi:hypothetical protein